MKIRGLDLDPTVRRAIQAWRVGGDLAGAERLGRQALARDEYSADLFLPWIRALRAWKPMVRRASLRRRVRTSDERFVAGLSLLPGLHGGRDVRRGSSVLRECARTGHVGAQVAAGFLRFFAPGRSSSDADAALEWFERGARSGDAVAAFAAGWLWDDAGVARRAVGRYRQAADTIPWAAFALAGLYSVGHGVRQDRAHANRLYLRAARMGDVRAMNIAGEMLRRGDAGVRRDRHAAVAWFRKAAARGEPSAMLSLGAALHEGEGVRRDDRDAVAWYRRAARHGADGACLNLFLCYLHGHGVPKNERRGIPWLRRAAEMGNPRAQTRLGEALCKGIGARPDAREAVRWFRRAAGVDTAGVWRKEHLTHGVHEAQDWMGMCFHNGKGVRQDYAASVRWYRLAAAGGNKESMHHLALCYRDGEGVPRSLGCARAWLERAAAAGSSYCRRTLRAFDRWSRASG